MASGAGLEVAEREFQQVVKQPAAKFDVDAAGRVVQGVGSQVLQNDVEEADQEQADRNDDQRRQSFVEQDFVDHDLEEQGRNKGEELDEQRGQEDVTERLTIAPDGRQKPTELELARIDAGPARAPRDEDNGA